MLAQQAIIVTKDNASSIAAQVDYTAQEILDESLCFLNRGHMVVLVRNNLNGESTVSHIALVSMFYMNYRPIAELTDKHFVDIVQR